MTTNDVKPWDGAQIEVMRRASERDRLHETSTSRWLATLDERTRERDEARADAARDVGLEAMAREEAERMLRSASDLRDALDSVAGVLGVDTSTDADTEARACVAAVASLREEVAQLRGERDQAIEDRNTSHTECARLWQTERDARAAAERRAEEALVVVQRIYDRCRRGVESSTRRASTLRGFLLSALFDAEAALGILAATHPPQQQTPAPAATWLDDARRMAALTQQVLRCTWKGGFINDGRDRELDRLSRRILDVVPVPPSPPLPPGERIDLARRDGVADKCSACGHRIDEHRSMLGGDFLCPDPRDDVIEALRSRVRELEGRLSAGVTRARWVRDASRGTSNERSAIDALLGWGGDTERWLAALPSQEQPAAPTVPEVVNTLLRPLLRASARYVEDSSREALRRLHRTQSRVDEWLLRHPMPDTSPLDDDAAPPTSTPDAPRAPWPDIEEQARADAEEIYEQLHEEHTAAPSTPEADSIAHPLVHALRDLGDAHDKVRARLLLNTNVSKAAAPIFGAAPSTPEGEPGYDLPPDAPEIPEGEPADDDADPTKWQPGDVVAFVLRSDDGEWRRDSPEYTLQTRITVGWECWFKDWRVRHKTIYDSDVRRLIESGERRRYRRIRRSSATPEVDRGE